MLLKPGPSSALPRRETRLAGLRALVVDDHPTSRRVLAQSLTDLGMQQLAAKSGPDALEILEAAPEPFDFLIVDHRMPGMSGSRFLQIATGLPGWREKTRSVLLCSGPPPKDDCRASRVLLKPLATFELAEALTGLLEDGDRMRSPSVVLLKTPPPLHREALRILIAEDNEDNQFLMEVYMKRGGYEAVIVENGKQAVAAWEGGDFSLILMDGQMPEMDGLEATACIRKRELGRRNHPIPIIAVTAHADDSSREKFLSAGMTDYITKPIAYTDLVAAIERSRPVASAAA
jgi:CheY-like chemotaxis protein